MLERKSIYVMISVFILASCLTAIVKPWPREVKFKQEESISLRGRNKSGLKQAQYGEAVRKERLREKLQSILYLWPNTRLLIPKAKIYAVVRRIGPGIVCQG